MRYCLNNPLIYTDPDGEFIFSLLASIIPGAQFLLPIAMAMDMGALSGGANASLNGESFWKGAVVGSLAGGVGVGIGAGVNSALAKGGSFIAGFLGTSNVVSTGFSSGFVSGAAGGFSSSFILGFGNAVMNPNNKFSDLLLKGLDLGWRGAIGGGLWGGIAGGIDAVKNNRNFLTGADKQYGVYTLKDNGQWAFEPAKNVRNNDINISEVDKSKGIIIERSIYSTDLNKVSTLNPDGTRSYNLPKTPGKIGHGIIDIGKDISEVYTSFWGYRWHHQPITKIRHLFHYRSATGWKDFFIYW